MKSFTHLALALSLISGFALARSPKLVREVSPALHTLNIQEVASEGTVLKVTQNRPFTNYLIGIEAEVNLSSACTTYVGTETTVPTTKPRLAATIRAVGSTDPTVDACIQIAVAPVKTVVTYEMKVLTGGFVQAGRYQKELVEIVGAGRFLLVLDMDKDTVDVRPAK